MPTLAELYKQNTTAKGTTQSSLPVNTLSKQEDTDFWDDAARFGQGIGYLGEKAAVGFVSSIEGIWDFTASGIAKLFGADDWAEEQIANDWFGDWYSHPDEWFQPTGGWKVAGDVASGIGTSLPSMAAVGVGAGIAALSGGTLAPAAIGLISAGVAGLGAAGRGVKEAYEQTGELGGKEYLYGAGVGVVEGGIEGVTDALGLGGVGSVIKNFGKSATKSMASRVGVAMVDGFVGEAFEEGFSELVTPYIKKMTYDPNAKNATAQEILYASLVGGLSGAIMGGGGAAVDVSSSLISGTKAVNEGRTEKIIKSAEIASAFEDSQKTGIEFYERVSSSYKALSESLAKTGGEVKTANQRMMLGDLSRANVEAQVATLLYHEAANILNDAEGFVTRFNSNEYTDANGKPLNITVESLTKGFDRSNPKSIAEAIKTNDTLRTLSAMALAGKAMSSTSAMADSVLRGNILSKTDLVYLKEKGSIEEIEALSKALNIEDWTSLTKEDLADRLVEYKNNGGLDEYVRNSKLVDKIKKTKSTRSAKQGVIGLKSGNATRFNDGNLGIARDGDNYILYNFDTNIRSRLMTKEEVDTYLREYSDSANRVAETIKKDNTTVLSDSSKESKALGEKIADFIDAISQMFEQSKISKRKLKIAALSDSHKKTVEDIMRAINKNFSADGYELWIDGTGAEHIINRHGEKGQHDNSMASRESKELISQVTNFPDGGELIRDDSGKLKLSNRFFNEDGTKAPQIRLYKVIDEDTVYVSECVPDAKNKRIYITSAYKKSSTNQLLNIDSTKSPQPTSETSFDSGATINSIPHPAEKINTSEKKTAVEVESVDSWARVNIPDYAGLVPSAKAMVREVIRQARANGLSEADVKMWADMSAHSGLDVTFDKRLSKTKVKVKQEDGTVKEEIKFVNAYYDEGKNRIVANPEARISQEKALFHELDHALRAFYKKKGINISLKYKKALDNVDEDTEAQIKKEYGDDQAIIDDETTAFYAAEIMATKGYAKALATEQPSVMKRILSFFKEASNYKNERLSKAAKSYYKLYQKMYEEFSAANRGNNALSGAEGGKRYSLNIKYTDGSVEVLANARTLTNEQAVNYLKKAKAGQIRGHSYIPVRKDTPQVIIDTLNYAGEEVENLSLVMQVRKAQQAMSTKNAGNRSGNNVRSHALSPEDVVEIINKLDEPNTIILQTNRQDKDGNALPNNVAVFVDYSTDSKEGFAVIEFESSIDPEFVSDAFGDANYHTVVTLFEPDIERNGVPFDYAEELLSNPNNIELEIRRRQPQRSVTREKHPNTSIEPPSSNRISQNSEKSTPSTKKDGEANLPEGARASLDIDSKNSFTSTTKSDTIKNKDLFTSTDEFYRQVPNAQRSVFSRSLANKTMGMIDGEIRTIYVCGYIFEADGYMQGRILAPYNEKTKKLLEVKSSAYTRIDEDRETASLWSQTIQYAGRGSGSNSNVPRGRRPSADDRLLGESPERHSSGNNERVRQTFETKEEIDEIVKKLRAMYGLDDSSSRRYSLDLGSIREQTKGKVLTEMPERYKPKIKDKAFSGWTSLQISLTNEQAGIEKIGKKLGIKDIEARVQTARAAINQAQEMVGGNQYRIGSEGKEYQGDGLAKIFEPIEKAGDTEDFNTYLLHWHNTSRMSLEERSRAEIAAAQGKYDAEKKKLDSVTKKIKKLIKERDAENADKKAINKTLKAERAKLTSLRKSVNELQKQFTELTVEENKPIFIVEENGKDRAVTADESRAIIAEMDKEHPEFKAVAEKVWAYNRNLNQYRVDTGLISQEDFDYLNKKYPHYVPTYRDGGAKGITPITGNNSIAVKTTVKTAKGSGAAVLPIKTIIARQTMETIRAGRINQLAKAMYDASGVENDYIAEVSREKNTDLEVNPTDVRPKDNQITFFENGEKVTLAVSKEIFQGFEGFHGNALSDNVVYDTMRKVNNGFKKLVTSFSPAFMIRNPIRDLQDAGIYTKYGKTFAQNYARAGKLIASDSKEWQLYRAMGGLSSSLFNFDTGTQNSQTKWGFTKEENKLLRYTVGVIENANSFVEQLPRFAEFLSAIEAGVSPEQAILDAADVTTNFGRTGKITKILNSTVIPFLNPSIQGFSKMIRSVTSIRTAREAGALFIKAALIGIVPMALNMLMYGDDDDYKDLRDNDKENNFLIKVGDTFIKLPRGRVASALGGLVNRTTKAANGEDADWAGYLENVSQQVTPVDSMSRTIFSPFTDVATNTTWYGTAIEGRQFENVAPKDRYDESTSEIAKVIGQVINYSPKKIHYLLDQYTGVIGDFILPLTTKRAEKDFFSGNFTIDPAASNKLSTDFYKLYDEAQYAKSAGNDVATYQVKYLNSVKSAVNELFKEKSAIQNSDLSSAEKLQQTRVIQVLINEAYKTALNDYELYTKAFETTASITDEKLRYTESIRLTHGAERAFKEYDKDVYEKYSLIAQSGISYDELYYYYFSLKQIESDKDEDGNTIAGSKKQKVLELINSLNISKDQKMLLLAASGYTVGDKSTKQKLARYITSLSKVSKDDKTALAELCGYKVVNGTILLSSIK